MGGCGFCVICLSLCLSLGPACRWVVVMWEMCERRVGTQITRVRGGRWKSEHNNLAQWESKCREARGEGGGGGRG